MSTPVLRAISIVLALFVIACGTPRVATPPTQPARISETSAPTAVLEPTVTPQPTEVSHTYLTHAAMGDAWPLTVEEGTIICDGAAILIRTDHGLFAVNGTARGQGKWKDVRDITKIDPATGLRMSVQVIIDNGLKACA